MPVAQTGSPDLVGFRGSCVRGRRAPLHLCWPPRAARGEAHARALYPRTGPLMEIVWRPHPRAGGERMAEEGPAKAGWVRTRRERLPSRIALAVTVRSVLAWCAVFGRAFLLRRPWRPDGAEHHMRPPQDIKGLLRVNIGRTLVTTKVRYAPQSGRGSDQGPLKIAAHSAIVLLGSTFVGPSSGSGSRRSRSSRSMDRTPRADRTA